jgi:tRNA pseudouridine38-40 synthase
VSTYRLELQYDGTDMCGWAKQPGGTSVEGSLEEAFSRVLGAAPRLVVAGRTDAGVHARRQVVSFSPTAPLHSVDLPRLLHSLNALTPPGIAGMALEEAPDGFDARRDARVRSYRYFIWLGRTQSPFVTRYSWHVPQYLDLDAMAAAAAVVLGRHDFTAFTPLQSEHVHFIRTVERCRWRRRGSVLWLEISASTFMRHMVRTLVGTMTDVGRGERSVDDFAALLDGRPRTDAGVTAPPHGLFLWRIGYGGRGDL